MYHIMCYTPKMSLRSDYCNGPNVMLFIHITSFMKYDEEYGLFYVYDFINEKRMKNTALPSGEETP